MSVNAAATVLSSGQMLLLNLTDGAGSPAKIISLAPQGQVQRVTLARTPAGGTFTLSLAGNVTAPIVVAAELPPPVFFQWNFTLPAPGPYDIAVYLPYVNAFGNRVALYEVFDNGAHAGTATLDQTDAGLLAGSFTDGTTFGPGSTPVPWIPVGRFTFATTAASVRFSGNAPANGVTESLNSIDSIRVAAVGGAHFRVGPDSPPATVGGAGRFAHSDTVEIPGSSAGQYDMQTEGAGPSFTLDLAAIRSALEALPNVGAGNVTVTGDGSRALPIRVVFRDQSSPTLVGSDPAVGVAVAAAGPSWPKISINGGPPLTLPYPFWGATQNPNPYLPFAAFPLFQPYAAASHERMQTRRHVLAGNWYGGAGTGQYAYTSYGSIGVGASATWMLEGVPPGQYRLSATWPIGLHGPGGSPVASSADVTFAVAGRSGSLATYHADQSIAPAGALDQGVRWAVLGTLTLTAPVDDLTVTLANHTADAMTADSIRFERVSADDSTRIGPGDVVTYSAEAGWALTTAGPAPAAVDVAVLNKVGATLYPPVDGQPKSMPVGYNITNDGSNAGNRIYANLYAVATYLPAPDVIRDADGYPTAFRTANPGDTYAALDAILISPPAELDSPTRDGLSFPGGHFTLLWDGSTELTLFTFDPIAEVGSPTITGGVGNRRTFDVQPGPGALTPFLYLRAPSTTKDVDGNFLLDARNIRVYPPGIDPDNPPKYLPGFLAKIRSARSLRFLDPIGAIFGNNVDYSDYQPAQSRGPKTGAQSNRTVRVIEVRAHPFNGTPAYDDRYGMAFQVTTDVPHLLVDGNIITFSIEAGPILVTGGSPPQTLLYQTATIRRTSATTFTFQNQLEIPYVAGGYTLGHPVSMTNVVGDVGGAFTVISGNNMSLHDMVELCNLGGDGNGADLHLNTGVSNTDACLSAIGDYVARNLAPGRKVRHEFTNETWNSSAPPFTYMRQQTFALGLGGGDNYVPFYCEEADRHWGLVRAAMEAAGRSGDHVRTLGTMFGSPSLTDSLAAYCADPGRRFAVDELALAPYLENAASFVVGGINESGPEHALFADRLTPDQDLDLLEAFYTLGGYERTIPAHRERLNTNGYSATRIITYEGGPEYLTLIPGRPPSRHYRRSHAVHRHPRFYHLILHVLRTFQDGGLDLFQFFFLAGIGDYTFGGQLPMWGVYTGTPLQATGTGDPTLDAANVATYDRPDLVKSEVGGAVDYWNSLVPPAGSSPTPTPTPTTVPAAHWLLLLTPTPTPPGGGGQPPRLVRGRSAGLSWGFSRGR